jgi:hypothetical protein
MTKEQIKEKLIEAIDHVREGDCNCDLCQVNANTAQKVRNQFPDSWFGEDLQAVNDAVKELANY